MAAKLLCPIDFSPGSEQALRVAARMAGETGAELVVAHAWSSPLASNEFPLPAETLRLMSDEARDGLARATNEALGLGAKRVSSRFVTGAPWHQIVEIASADPEIDLVVIGTHGRTGLSRFLLGSVAEKVVRHAPISVLVTRGAPPAARFEHVLGSIDFSDSSRHVMSRTGELAASGGRIALVHVIELPITPSGGPPPSDFLVDLDRRASDQLEQLGSQLGRTTLARITTDVRIGNPAEEMLELLDGDPTFDLVVVGSHGRTGLQRVLLGSVAEKLVRHARCSVLVARAARGLHEHTS